MCVCARVRVLKRARVSVYVSAHLCVFICLCVCLCICVCACVCECVNVCLSGKRVSWRCLASICPVSAADICPVSTARVGGFGMGPSPAWSLKENAFLRALAQLDVSA